MNEKWFLLLGRLEGVSLLFLMFIAMPIKYLLQNPEWVKHAGRAHGGLFIAYCVAALMLSEKRNWSRNTLALAWGLSCLPFGTFIFEKKYLNTRPES